METKESNHAIPHVLFQTYLTKDPAEMPFGFPEWQATWRKHHPEWKHIMWDDAENRNFIEKHFSWFLTTYDSYLAEINRADAVRYFFLFFYGGVYADMDFEALRPLDPLVAGHDGQVLLGTLRQDASDMDGGSSRHSMHYIPNAIMASPPRHPFWLTVFSLLMRVAVNGPTEHVTGPVLLKAAVNEYRAQQKTLQWIQRGLEHESPNAQLTLLEPHVFYPVDWTTELGQQMRKRVFVDKHLLTVEETAELFPHSYAVTYWAHSWGDKTKPIVHTLSKV